MSRHAVFKNQHEFLASISERPSTGSHVFPDDFRKRHKHLVAGNVSEFIIDLLEKIDVEHDQKRIDFTELFPLDDSGNRSIQCTPVVKLGERFDFQFLNQIGMPAV